MLIKKRANNSPFRPNFCHSDLEETTDNTHNIDYANVYA